MTAVLSLRARLLAGISRYLTGRPRLQKAVANTGWLLADKVVRQVVNLSVGVWVARYLGPAQFGSLNYALSIVLLFSALGSLGLDRIVVRDAVREPSQIDEILGTALCLRLASGLLTVVLPVGLIQLIRPNDGETLLLVGIIAAGNLFQAFDAIDFIFQSKLQSKYTIYAKSSAFLAASIAKVFLIVMKAPLIAFGWVALAEVVIGAGSLVLVLQLTGKSLRCLAYSGTRARRLLRESWPLILSGMAIMAYMRIDQAMLGEMKGFAEVGIYAAAVRLSEVWSFIPIAISTSVFPALIESRSHSSELYKQRLQKLFYVMTGLAYAIAIPMSFVSGRLMVGLYGKEYAAAGPVLSLHIWGAPFLFLGIVRGFWAVNEGLTKFIFATTFLGTIINIFLNLMLIPRYGSIGAAISLLASQIIASYLSNLAYHDTRGIFALQSRALFPVQAIVSVGRHLGRRRFLL